MKKIVSIVGARPNFMKMAPVHRALSQFNQYFDHFICHTGQHFDKYMSGIFFNELGIPDPHVNLGKNSGSHAVQTASIMISFEQICVKEKPDLVIVYGDINSTMACSIVAKKLGIQIAHVEAGLRSFDRGMPEEINRVITDSISDIFFISEIDGMKNLLKEGISHENMIVVGNTMIDSLVYSFPTIKRSGILRSLNLIEKQFITATFHRPSNVDSKNSFINVIDFLNDLSVFHEIVFPIHPRSCQNLEKFGLLKHLSPKIRLLEPLGYHDFLWLVANSLLVVTDSGGIQEETTYLKIPCLTLRTSTERPATINIGSNILCGNDFSFAFQAAKLIFHGIVKNSEIPDKWDGKASERIITFLINHFKLNEY